MQRREKASSTTAKYTNSSCNRIFKDTRWGVIEVEKNIAGIV
jgi:hypothetical protein